MPFISLDKQRGQRSNVAGAHTTNLQRRRSIWRCGLTFDILPSIGQSCGDLAPDIVLLSSDSVFFYVHSSAIRSASNNTLCGFLTSNSSKNPQAADQATLKCPDGTMSSDDGIELVMLPDQSQVLDIMLHFIYNISPAHHSPPFHIISQAVERLRDAYGVDVHRVMQGSALGLSSPHSNNVQSYNQPHESSLSTFLAAHAPLYPIDVYALTASIDLYSLAQNASLYLHELDLCPTDDEDCAGGKLKPQRWLGRWVSHASDWDAQTQIGSLETSRVYGSRRAPDRPSIRRSLQPGRPNFVEKSLGSSSSLYSVYGRTRHVGTDNRWDFPSVRSARRMFPLQTALGKRLEALNYEW